MKRCLVKKLQQIEFNRSGDRICAVFYKSADTLFNAALSEKVGAVVFCVQLGDISFRHLVFRIRSLLMNFELLLSLSSKLFARRVTTVVKRDETFLDNVKTSWPGLRAKESSCEC